MSTISKFAGRVVCTKAQFDALAEKDPNKEYLVTDDDTYGGGKLYLHYIIGSVNESSSFSFNVCLYTSSSEPINSNDKAFNVLNIGENQNRVIIGFFNGNKKYCCGVKFDKSLSAPVIRIEYLSETGNNISKEANINNDFVTEL